MIQRALAGMLQRLLGKFLSLDAGQLELSIWDGDLTFTDLQLRLAVGRGVVGALQVQIPWRSLWSQPVIVKAQRIRIYLHANATTSEPVVTTEPTEEQDKTYLSKLLACIISNVQIELEDIEIRYECEEDSVEKTPGYVVCAIDKIGLQNTDSEWVQCFIDPANGAKESRKRLLVDGISAYVVPYSHAEEEERFYVFHDWSSDIKATLSYQSAGAAIPDVELSILLNQSSQTTSCTTCRSVAVKPNVLTFHLESVHIDVLCAVLNEVKTPYDHYDKLTILASNTRANQGFAVVLAYAKQWLLADVAAPESGSPAQEDDDDDDDDLFQDAVAPPSLTIQVAIVLPVHISIFPRSDNAIDEYVYSTDRTHWILSIEGTKTLWRQSCVETEVQVEINAVALEEYTFVESAREVSNLLHITKSSEEKPWLQVECHLPEDDIGSQTTIKWDMEHAMHLVVSEASCWKWNQLISPVWIWWDKWSSMYPSRAQLPSTTDTASPMTLPLIDLKVCALTIEVAIDEPHPFVFGCRVNDVVLMTNEAEQVTSTFSWRELHLYSVTSEMQHSIWRCPNTAIVMTNANRSAKQSSEYLCQHIFTSGSSIPMVATSSDANCFDSHFKVSCEETPVYSIKLVSSDIRVELTENEYRHLHVLLGKWLSSNPNIPSAQKSPHCTWVATQYAMWSFSCVVPSLTAIAIDSTGDPWGYLSLNDLKIDTKSCSSITHTTCSIGSLLIRDEPSSMTMLNLPTGVWIEHAKCPRSGFTLTDKMTLSGLPIDVVQIKVTQVQPAVALYMPFLSHVVEWLAMGNLHASIAAGQSNKESVAPTSNAIPQVWTPRDTIHNTSQLQIYLEYGLRLDMYHVHEGIHKDCDRCSDPFVLLGTISTSHVSITQYSYEQYCDILSDMRGTVKQLTLTDQTHPLTTYDAKMLYPNVIDSQSNASQHLDFRFFKYHDEKPIAKVWSCLQLRLDSVAIHYLHRVYKQFSHYLRDLVLPKLLWTPLSSAQRSSIYTWHGEEYKDEEADTSNDEAEAMSEFRFELVAHDLSFNLPRNSFSADGLTLKSANGTLSTVHVGMTPSVFIQSGLFFDEENGHLDSVSSMTATTRLQELRRRELRNLRRIVKAQRAQLLVSRGQLLADHKTALRQKHHYMHLSGLDKSRSEIVAQADQACAILSSKFESVEENLGSLQTHLKFLESEIEATKSMEDDQASDRVQNGRYRSRSIETIEESVSSMPQYATGSLFGAEDAMFHDATEDAAPADTLPWIVVDLIGLSGWTDRIASFEKAICSLTIDYKDQYKSMADGTMMNYPVLWIEVLLNEWNVRLHEQQYATILGFIHENFKEVNSVVYEDIWPICEECGGFHFESDGCNVEWLRIPIRVIDASLTLAKTIQAPSMESTLRFEELHMNVAMRTSDVMDIHLKTESLSIIDHNGMEIVRPMQAFASDTEGQVLLHAHTNWTDGIYTINVNRSQVIVIPASLKMLSSYFSWPFWAETPPAQLVFVRPPHVDWKLMEVHVIFDKQSCFYLLEDLSQPTSRTLVLMSQVQFEYTMTQDVVARTSATKMNLTVEQRGFYFSALPDLHIDVDFPLMNPFTLQVMHLMEYLHRDGSMDATQRNAISLQANNKISTFVQPVEARLSVQDFTLLSNIFHTYSTAPVREAECGPVLDYVEVTPRLLNDRLLADIGAVRIVLVNNSLGVPIADLMMSEIECQYEAILDEGATLSMGGILHSNYFNNSIYRWEPLVEPFEVQSISDISPEKQETVNVKVNLPFTLNLNMTPAMAPLLSMESLQMMDAVTTGEKVTTPFWLKNSLGSTIKFSFAHGQSFIQRTVEDSEMVPIDCRDKSTHLRTFDKASEVDSLIYHKSNLTASHSLYVWVSGSKWASVHPVTVDVVGNIAICMKLTEDATEDFNGQLEPPAIVAEVSLQEDGSKLIHLHSQVLIRNETAMPLMIWGFSPPGNIKEWIVERDSTSYVPLDLIHPEACLSIRPSIDTQYAPLASSFAAFESDIKSSNLNFTTAKRRFVKSGQCMCPYKGNGEKMPCSGQLLSGLLVRDLPSWQCVYDVEAFVLLNTSIGKPTTKSSRRLSTAGSIQADEDTGDDDFQTIFEDQPSTPGTKGTPQSTDVLEEAKHAKQGQINGEPIYSHILTIKPYLTLHNRLASPVAYRVLGKSLQLVAEGILPVGDMLPLFQVNGTEDLFVSFRLENYNWSEPFNAASSKVSIPFKESVDGIILKGRQFPDTTTYKDAQGPVPELQVRLKRKDRDIIVYSALWIVNHTGLPLEYCDAVSRNPKVLESTLTYLHARPGTSLASRFLPSASRRRSLVSPSMVSPAHQQARDDELRQFEKPALIVPIALSIIIYAAKDLFNSHKYFGSQSPYVKASLFIPRHDKKTKGLIESLYCFATTRAVANGGVAPVFDKEHINTLHLPFPTDPTQYQLHSASVIIEVRSTWLGAETNLGMLNIPLMDILSRREYYAGSEWHPLVKRKSKNNTTIGTPSGHINLSIVVATTHAMPSDDHPTWGTIATTPRRVLISKNDSNTVATPSGEAYNLVVYLPTNRFSHVVVQVQPSTTLSQVIEKVMSIGGMSLGSVVVPTDYVFFELVELRFVSLRSAGRPEGDRWYGNMYSDMDMPLRSIGRKFGLHLCHRISMNTLRLYDESSTASVHHSTPRALMLNRQQSFPSQARPVEWSEVINFGSRPGTSSNWDVLRVRTSKCSWSDTVRIHRNAMGNSGVAQQITLVEITPPGVHASPRLASTLTPRKQYELALWSSYGAGAFCDTIITTLVPRYVLINRTSFPLWYRQHNCNIIATLQQHDFVAYHWDKADEAKKSLEVTFADSTMQWSGPFALHSLGTTYLKLRGKDNPHSIYILQAQLELVGGSIVCVFCDESKRWPPYRIDNFTSFRLHFHQSHWPEDIWDEVGPRSSVPYSWDSHEGSLSVSADGNQSHVLERFLEVRFMQISSNLSSLDVSNAIVDTKEYNLDAMQKHKRLQLTRSLPASLFSGGCALEGTLLKKDNAFNWSKRYFRVHEHMVYYFLTEQEHSLRGVIDLGLGSSIIVKGWTRVKRKSTTTSLNPLRSMTKSISDTLFGEDKQQDPYMNINLKMQSMEYAIWLASLLKRSKWLEEKANEWLQALTLTSTDLTPAQLFLAAGKDIVQLILEEDLAPSRNHAAAQAQHLLQCGLLMIWNPPPDMDVDNIIFEDKEMLYRIAIPNPLPTASSSFTILTPSKTYSLRAESPEESLKWCTVLRQAIVSAMDHLHEAKRRRQDRLREEKITATTTTKTYVHARVRADGPTKVLELTEGGEEDDDVIKDINSLRGDDSMVAATSKRSMSIFQHVTVQCTLHSIGLSCVNSQPMEIIYVSLQGVMCQFHRHADKMRFAITVRDIQADNQVPEATFTTMVCPKDLTTAEDEPEPFSCVDCHEEQEAVAVAFHFCCGWTNEQGSTDYFEYCSFHLLPMIVQLDEELVSVLRDFLMQVLYQQQGVGQKYLSTAAMDMAPLLNVQQVVNDFKASMESSELDPLHNLGVLESASAATSTERKVYFALLHIHPVELDMTFRSDVISGSRTLKITENYESITSGGDEDQVQENVAAWIPSLSMHVPDLDNAPIRLNALVIEHAFGTSGEVTRRVTKYYTRQLWKQVHKVLGSFDFLGNPAGLLDHLGTAVRDLIVEPIHGARTGSGITGTGVGFGKGLAKGATSFVTNFIDGTSDATSKVTGTFGQGLATMSFDSHYQQERAKARRRHVRGFKEGIMQGSRELTLGMVEGVTGVVWNPIRGAQSDGAVGFLRGAVTGLIGLPMKPVAGVFDFASRATQGIRNRSLVYGRQGMRVRLPRVFGRYNELRCYKEEDVAASMLVGKTGTNEKIIYHTRLEQQVAADALAKKAKQAQQAPAFLPLHRHVLRMERFESESELDAEGGKRATYSVVFSKKSLGLELETDFYNESVVIKQCLDRSGILSAATTARDVTQKLLMPGDIIVQIGDVDVRKIGFRETIALIKGSARPVTITFESAEVFETDDDRQSEASKTFVYSPSSRHLTPSSASIYSKLTVKQVHWVIITDSRVLYVQWESEESPLHMDAVLEWSAPLKYIHSIEVDDHNIHLHLRVGVNSLFTGPLSRPEWKHETPQAIEAMKTFSSVMHQSFRGDADVADVQEVYPSDTSFSGYLRVAIGSGSKRRRWCVLCRNCLYLFTTHAPRVLRYIVPLGRLFIQKTDALQWTLTNVVATEPLQFCSVDGPVVGQRMDMSILMIADKVDDVEMWVSALAHAAGKGMRHSKGTRFYAPSEATTLSIGCHEAKPHIVAALEDALRKTLAVFKA